MSVRQALAAVLLALSSTSLAAQERSLNWPSITVTAHLDADGQLHVNERQRIRFTGDWNGGERYFNLRSGQSIELLGMSRVDSTTGTDVAMDRGDLSELNHFDWTDTRTVRWRSRQPSDPPFQNTTIGYNLQFVFSNILNPQDDGSYQLDHDFAFPDREGSIESFVLELTMDTVWHSATAVPKVYRRGNLEPGESFTVTLPLTFHGATLPTSVLRGASARIRFLMAIIFGSAVFLLLAMLVVRERALGRFAPLVPERDITPSWLKQHVFSRLPEVAGAAWDDQTSAPEVAATLARLVQEGKLSSRVESTPRLLGNRDVLHLTITGNRDRFQDHELALINALFTSKSRTTDTDSVRRRYADSGFDPAALIRSRLKVLIEQAAPGQARHVPSRWVTVAWLVLAIVVTTLGIMNRPRDAAAAFPFMGAAIPLYLIAIGFAYSWRRRVHRFMIMSLLGLIPIAVFTFVICSVLMMQGTMRLSAMVLAGIALWYFGLINSVVNMARSRQSAERIQLRKQLTSARNYFRTQLAQRQPQLNDAWFPYLIAFGLGHHIDKWFRAFGGERSVGSDAGFASSTHMSSMSTSADTSSGSGWTGFGGGGGFSGAGGGASFASAVGGMAASVPAPSSSDSSSGGSSSSSSSGGSSGGGGGGGW